MRISEFPIIDEIRGEYEKYRQNSFSRDEAVAKLLDNYNDELTTGSNDDGLLFWIGIADAQYACKELSQESAERGLAALNDIEQTAWQVSQADIKHRRKHYAVAPMPERKRFPKSRKFRCSWQIGDTFAYQLSGPDADACGLTGRYVLLRKVDELEFSDGRLLPVVTFTMWDDKPLPNSAAEFQRLPLLKLVSGRLGLSKTLHEYRAELLIKNKSKLDALSIIYLGNFVNITMPADEVIIRDAGRVMLVSPERLDWECCIFWKWHSKHTQQD